MATVLIAFLVIMFLGVPLALAMGAAGLIGLGNLNIVVMAQQLFVGLNSFTMIAIPLFIFMGNLMTDSGLTEKLINFCNSLFGRRFLCRHLRLRRGIHRISGFYPDPGFEKGRLRLRLQRRHHRGGRQPGPHYPAQYPACNLRLSDGPVHRRPVHGGRDPRYSVRHHVYPGGAHYRLQAELP